MRQTVSSPFAHLSDHALARSLGILSTVEESASRGTLQPGETWDPVEDGRDLADLLAEWYRRATVIPVNRVPVIGRERPCDTVPEVFPD